MKSKQISINAQAVNRKLQSGFKSGLFFFSHHPQWNLTFDSLVVDKQLDLSSRSASYVRVRQVQIIFTKNKDSKVQQQPPKIKTHL